MAAEGYTMLSADYCQMELRMMAHASGDPLLCQLLQNPTHDPFTMLASRWKKVPLFKVSMARKSHVDPDTLM